mgnify:CR=1 FL=1
MVPRTAARRSRQNVSGVVITASEPVAVFTGATIVNIPDEPIVANPPAGCKTTSQSCVSNGDCCSGLCGYDVRFQTHQCVNSFQAGDHIEQQLFPVESWGTSYVAAPFFNRGSNDFVMYRLVAATDGTTVTLDPPVDGVSSFTLNRGQYRQIVSADAFELTASNPVMLAQFMIGGQNSAAGDGDPSRPADGRVESWIHIEIDRETGRIGPDDLDMLTLTDDVSEAVELMASAREEHPK